MCRLSVAGSYFSWGFLFSFFFFDGILGSRDMFIRLVL